MSRLPGIASAQRSAPVSLRSPSRSVQPRVRQPSAAGRPPEKARQEKTPLVSSKNELSAVTARGFPSAITAASRTSPLTPEEERYGESPALTPLPLRHDRADALRHALGDDEGRKFPAADGGAA